uniref:Uncharacterized protein n=1 Tax=Octactis speculum TaxID=3111310 RepID=A0A7S2G4F0_9STRA
MPDMIRRDTPRSILVVSSGPVDPALSTDAAACAALSPYVGAGNDDTLHSNNVKYVAENACADGLFNNHGATGYDNVDPDIHPLEPHYHTRGAFYYDVIGNATFDTGVSNLIPGEARFVQEGYFYGPEVLSPWDENATMQGAIVISVHDPDPAAVSWDPDTHDDDRFLGDDDRQHQPHKGCAFGCYNDPGDSPGVPTQRCVKPSDNTKVYKSQHVHA